MTNYHNLAIDTISKIMGYEPFFPKTEAMVMAYAEALEDSRLDHWPDLDKAVRIMFRENTDPKFRPTPGLVCKIAREVKKDRLEREPVPEIEGPPKITFSEWRERQCSQWMRP